MASVRDIWSDEFQPALPLRGVTYLTDASSAMIGFQPALPLRGVTNGISSVVTTVIFQPALPLRGVTSARGRWK